MNNECESEKRRKINIDKSNEILQALKHEEKKRTKIT